MGQPISKTLSFHLVAFRVTFMESGLPAGTTWSVTFNSTKQSGTANLTFPGVRNGTYGFTVGLVEGQTANRTSGAVKVLGGAVSEPIMFAPSAPPLRNGTGPAKFLGLPAMEWYGVLGGVIIAILAVVAAVVLLRRRGGKAPPEPEKSPSGADATTPKDGPERGDDSGRG